jgi:hypothetical protein
MVGLALVLTWQTFGFSMTAMPGGGFYDCEFLPRYRDDLVSLRPTTDSKLDTLLDLVSQPAAESQLYLVQPEDWTTLGTFYDRYARSLESVPRDQIPHVAVDYHAGLIAHFDVWSTRFIALSQDPASEPTDLWLRDLGYAKGLMAEGEATAVEQCAQDWAQADVPAAMPLVGLDSQGSAGVTGGACEDLPAYGQLLVDALPESDEAFINAVEAIDETDDLATIRPSQWKAISEYFDQVASNLEAIPDDAVPSIARDYHAALIQYLSVFSSIANVMASGNILGALAYTESIERIQLEFEAAEQAISSECGAQWEDSLWEGVDLPFDTSEL